VSADTVDILEWHAWPSSGRPVHSVMINYAAPWLLDTQAKVDLANATWAAYPAMDIVRAEPWKLGDHCWFAPIDGYK